MKFFKSLLLCFLFFGLGNFKAQKIEKISNEEQSRFVFVENFQNLLMKNYAGKRNQINFKNAKLSDLKIQYLKNLTLLAPEDNINLKLLADYTFFSFYPNINAIILKNHSSFKEKLSDEEKQKYNAIFLEISKQIPNETYIELSKITDEINRDKFALTVPYRFEIFQDLFDENQRKRIDIINFLLWNVE